MATPPPHASRPVDRRRACGHWRAAAPTPSGSSRWRKALGVTKGGFYGYFDDRRALLEEMLDTWELTMLDERDRAGRGRGRRREAELRRLSALAGSADLRGLMRVDLAVRDWARRDPAVAERLRRVDNRRMDYMRSLFGAFCADEDEVEVRASSPSRLDRQPLHRRRSRRTQPRGRDPVGARAARGVGGLRPGRAQPRNPPIVSSKTTQVTALASAAPTRISSSRW